MKQAIDVEEKALYIYLLILYDCDSWYSQICDIFDEQASHLKGFDAMKIYEHPDKPDSLRLESEDKSEISRLAFSLAVKGKHLRATQDILKFEGENIEITDELVHSIWSLGPELWYLAIQSKLKIKRAKNSVINAVVNYIHNDEEINGTVVPIKSIQMVKIFHNLIS